MQIKIKIDYPDNEFYPLNLPHKVPDNLSRSNRDVVNPDALAIIDRLMNENDVRRIVWETFRDQFMDSTEYGESVYDAWKRHIR